MNPIHVPFVDGYRPGDPLRCSELLFDYDSVTVDEAARLAFCERVFRAMNEGERSNESRERSLSVGDVLVMHVQGELVPYAYKVDGASFVRLEGLPWVMIGCGFVPPGRSRGAL